MILLFSFSSHAAIFAAAPRPQNPAVPFRIAPPSPPQIVPIVRSKFTPHLSLSIYHTVAFRYIFSDFDLRRFNASATQKCASLSLVFIFFRHCALGFYHVFFSFREFLVGGLSNPNIFSTSAAICATGDSGGNRNRGSGQEFNMIIA